MPCKASRCESSSPAGPAPTMPTWVREPTVMWERRTSLERIGGNVAADGHPAGIRERLQISRTAEAGTGTGGPGAAERDVRLVVDGLLVDMHDTGRYLPGQLEAAHDVPGQNAEGQAVLALGRQLGRVFRRGEPQHRGHRAEYLVGVRRRVRGDLGQHGRRVEQALVAAARGEPGARRDALGHQPVNLVALPPVDDRAERDLLRYRVPDRKMGGLVREPRDVLVVDRLVHEVAAGGHADLPLVQERAPG